MQGDGGAGATGPNTSKPAADPQGLCHGHGIFQAEVCFLKTIARLGTLLHFGDVGNYTQGHKLSPSHHRFLMAAMFAIPK